MGFDGVGSMLGLEHLTCSKKEKRTQSGAFFFLERFVRRDSRHRSNKCILLLSLPFVILERNAM